MTKVRLKEVSKELNQKTGVILAETERVKRSAETVLQMLRQQEMQFLRQEEEERQRLKYEKQQELIQQQAKAWTMPDDEAALAHPQPAPVEAPIVAQAPAAAVETAPQTADAKAAPEVAPPVTAEVAAPGKPHPEPAPAPAVITEPKPAPKPLAATPAVPSAAQAPQAAPAGAPAVRAASAPQPQSATPLGRYAPVGQPAYGRPAPGAQPYGRPAPGAQAFGRPAPAGTPGQYGRPAPAGQPFGRPAYPQQGPYGRPAPGAQQGNFAPRPPIRAGAPAPGGFGRPAQPSGFRPGMPPRPGFGRPAGMPPKPGDARPGGFRPGMPGRPRKDDAAPPMEKERVSNYDPNKKNYIRQHDPEHVSKNKRQLFRNDVEAYDDDVVRGGKRRGKKLSAQQLMAPIKIEKAYMTAGTITVKDLTERIGKPAGEILKKLLLLGNMATINSELDFDTAALVSGEYGVELEMKLDKTAEDELSDQDFEDAQEDLQPRPPVITIMGHVDHGKTSLLDYIRKAHVTDTEAGGITQHIGAYSVNVQDQQITFLDTPGHEAFTAMRARGAQATDIAVLVVAADDGVMPQTIEAINHAKAANVPIVVAINKMDKPSANPDRIKQDLTSYNLVAEEWGGDTIMVPVSALTGQGVDRLLEMILLQAEVLQLRANPDRNARGIIIEAKLDKSRGPLATVLLQNGTLRIGDNIIAGMASGRVRAMLNDRGERVNQAGPSTPVEISGFDDVPLAGDEMMVTTGDRLSKQVAAERKDKEKEQRAASATKVSLDNLFDNISEGKVETLNLVIKADVQGSVEAVRQALEKLSNDKVKVRTLHSGVGAITKDDVNLASAFNAIIIGFNIRPDASARDAADKEGIDIRLYRIIYQAIEDIEKAMKGMLEPEFKETVMGHAEVRNVFKITGAGTIAGCYVTDGKLQRNNLVRLLRDNVVIHEGKLSSLRRFKDDVKEVAEGFECGVGLENYNDIKEKDVIECFVMQEIV